MFRGACLASCIGKLLLGLAALNVFSLAAEAQQTPAPSAVANTPESPADKAERLAALKERDRDDRETRRHASAGRWDEAIATALKMLAIERKVLGDEHEDADGSREWLASLYAVAGQPAEAEKMARQLLERHTRQFGEDHWRTRSSKDLLKLVEHIAKLDATQRGKLQQAERDWQQAVLLYGDRQFEPALAPLRRAGEARRTLLGDALAACAQPLRTLGHVNIALNRPADARAAYEQAAKVFRRALGNQHPDYASCLHGLGSALSELGSPDKAAANHRQASEIRREALGPDHANTLASLDALSQDLSLWAGRLEEADDVAQARKVRQQEVEVAGQLYAADDWRVTNARVALRALAPLERLSADQRKRLSKARELHRQASHLYDQKDNQAALAACDQALAIRREILGADSLPVASSANLLGLIVSNLQQYDRAVSLIGQALAVWRKEYGPAHPESALGLHNLGVIEAEAGRLDQAAQALEEASRIRASAYGERDSDTRSSLQELVWALGRQADARARAGDFGAAIKSREQALQTVTRLHGAADWRTVDARQALDLAARHSALGAAGRERLATAAKQLAPPQDPKDKQQAAAAVERARQALPQIEELLGAKSLEAALARKQFAVLLFYHGDYAESEQLLSSVAQRLGELLGTEHPQYGRALADLAVVLGQQKHHLPAADALRRLLEVRVKLQGAADADTVEARKELLAELEALAAEQESAGNLPAAQKSWQEILELRKIVAGPKHSSVNDAAWALYRTQLLPTLSAAQREQRSLGDRWVEYTRKLVELSSKADQEFPRPTDAQRAESIRKVVEAAAQALQLRRAVWGESDPATAEAWELLATGQALQRDVPGLRASYAQALAIRRKAQGENHPDYLATRRDMVVAVADTMAVRFQRPSKLTAAQQARIAQRDRLDERANDQRRIRAEEEQESVLAMLAIEREVYGEAHDEVARSWQRLAEIAEERHDYEQAVFYWRQTATVRAVVYGKTSWQVRDARFHINEITDIRQLSDDDRERLMAVLKMTTQRPDGGDDQLLGADPEARRAGEILRISDRALFALKDALGEDHLYYANCLDGEAEAYAMLGDENKSLALALQAINITGRVLGHDHPVYHARFNRLASGMKNRALDCQQRGDFAAAEGHWKQHIEVQVRHYGPQDWHVRNAQQSLLHCHRLAELSAEQRKTLAQYNPLDSRPDSNDEQAPDLAAAKSAYALHHELLGDDDQATIRAAANLALAYRLAGSLDQAVELYLHEHEICQRVLGPDHPETARCANDLGLAYYALADYVHAQPLLEQARAMRERLGLAQGANYAANLNNLAVLYEATGDFDRAEPLLHQVVNIQVPQRDADQDSGDEEPETAGSYESLMGEFNISLAMQRFGGNVTARAPPVQDLSELSKYINNLALVCQARHETGQAESLFRQALWLAGHDRSDTTSPDYIAALNNLAVLYVQQGQSETATLLLERVVQLRESQWKDQDPGYATAANNLGNVCFRQGDLDRTDRLWTEALRIRRQTLGQRHPNTVLSMANLALLAERRGQPAQAAQQLGEVLPLAMANLQLASHIQSERQQLLSAEAVRGYLDHYLSLSSSAALSADEVYPYVLKWKGSVSARQRRQHESNWQAASGGNPALRRLFQDLAATNRELATLTFEGRDSSDAKRGAKLSALAVRKDELERQIARGHKPFGRQLNAENLSVEQLKQSLGNTTALVDYFEYRRLSVPTGSSGNPTYERRLAAFVIRRGYPIVEQDLGPAAGLDALVDACRKFWLEGAPGDESNPPRALRKRVWEPLAENLHGIETVLVSPDGPLSRVPLAALPGKDPESYLLEDVALAVVPVPQLMAGAASATPAEARGDAPQRMLLVGDVDFEGEPGEPSGAVAVAAPRGGKLSNFGSLPGTREEVQAIKALYQARFPSGAVTLLDLDNATEEAFRERAPSAGYLHLATHGFFAPAEFKPARPAGLDPLALEGEAVDETSGWNPDLLSGIVLAGVNRPIAAGRDDGIVSAAEVADLDLSAAPLVVLSACETGLGQIAGGEGALGLQRAFQVAGARSVVSSLWKVDDQATRLLMAEFYHNLWQKRLPPLTAFRQAQLALLHDRLDPGKLRGLDVAEEPAMRRPAGGRLPPRLWAAFVVSGDWQ